MSHSYRKVERDKVGGAERERKGERQRERERCILVSEFSVV